MTSGDSKISEEARRLLADNYRLHKKPWYAIVAENPKHHQFDVALEVITKALNERL